MKFNKSFVLWVLCLPALLIFAPIGQQLYLRSAGELHYFATDVVDPRDVLRGHYVRLAFKNQTAASTEALCTDYQNANRNLYGLLERASDGLTQVIRIQEERPAGSAYLHLKRSYCKREGETWLMQIDFPFQRYYANEYQAPELEKMMGSGRLGVWIKDGFWALEALH